MIEVGEYVRTKKDGICKLIQIDPDDLWCGYVDKPFWLRLDNILKHSKNLIDLIEEGDYVNGRKVYSIGTAVGLEIINFEDGTVTGVKNIKSIVTHEQMKAIEYRVETEEKK